MKKVGHVVGVGLIAFLLLAASSDKPLDPKQIFAQSEPATVLIVADFSAHTVVPTAAVNEPALKGELTAEIDSGKIAGDNENALILRSVELLATQFDKFIMPTAPNRQADAKFEATGSGFIIDPKGYIVTNAHVAAPKDDEVKRQLAEIGLQSLVAEDVKSFETDANASSVNIPPDLLKQLADSDTSWIASHLQIADLTKSFSAALGANIPGISTSLRLIPGDVVAAGDPIPGKDVAILKVEQNNLPTLELGDDAGLQVGDKLFVLGYPGAATFHPLISKESISEPSFTAGQLSARKTATGGFTVLQTDAAVTHGNSGGPVFDSRGKVVGIATFISLQQGNNSELAGFNFIMPAGLIRQFVDRSGAHPAVGLFTTLYNKALDQEAASHFKGALKTLTEINTISPGHPYVQQHISLDQTAVSGGRDKGSGSPPLVPILAGIAVLALLAAGGLVLWRRIKRGSSTGPVHTQPIPAMSYRAVPIGEGGVTGSLDAPSSPVVPPPLTPMGSAPTQELPSTGGQRPETVGAAGPEDRESSQSPPERPPAAFCASCGADLGGQPFCGRCGAGAR